jgi:hypothetical protein
MAPRPAKTQPAAALPLAPVLEPGQALELDLESGRVLSPELRRDVLYLVKSPVPAIIDAQSLEAAQHIRHKALEAEKAIKAYYEDEKRPLYDAWKAKVAEENRFLEAVTTVDKKIRTAISVYDQAEEAKRRAEEARLAEERRLEEQARLEREAAAHELAGDVELAAATFEAAISTPAPVVALPRTTAAAGVKMRRDWKWRPTGGDTPEARAKALKLVPRQWLMLDEQKIARYIAGMKETADPIPGIEFYYVDVPVR